MARGIKGTESVEFRPKEADEILRVLRMGQPLSVALSFAGVSKPAFYRWLKHGQREGASPDLADFALGVAKAKEAARVMAVGSVFKGMSKDWKAAAWYLGVTNPKEYGQKVRVTLEQEFSDALERVRAAVAPAVYEQVLAAIVSGDGPAGVGEIAPGAPEPIGPDAPDTE